MLEKLLSDTKSGDLLDFLRERLLLSIIDYKEQLIVERRNTRQLNVVHGCYVKTFKHVDNHILLSVDVIVSDSHV